MSIIYDGSLYYKTSTCLQGMTSAAYLFTVYGGTYSSCACYCACHDRGAGYCCSTRASIPLNYMTSTVRASTLDK